MFAIIAGAFVPLNFTAVRLAEEFSHPRVLGHDRRLDRPVRCGSPSSSRCVGMACLFVTLWKYELASKHATFRLRALKRKLADEQDQWAPNPRRSAAPQL